MSALVEEHHPRVRLLRDEVNRGYGAALRAELVAKARKWNFRLVENGVRHYPRLAGETKSEPSDIPRTLKVVFAMWQRIHVPTRRQLDGAADVRNAQSAEGLEYLPERARARPLADRTGPQ